MRAVLVVLAGLFLQAGVLAQPTRTLKIEAYPPETTIHIFTPKSPPEGDLAPNNQEFPLKGRFLSLQVRLTAPGYQSKTEEVLLTDVRAVKPQYWVHQTRLTPSSPTAILRTQWDLNPVPIYLGLGGLFTLLAGGAYLSARRRALEKAEHQHALAAAASQILKLAELTDPVHTNLVGQEVDGFRILERLGDGAYSVVYKAQNIQHGDLVALKLLKLGQADEESLARLRREIAIGRDLDHPNVVRMYAFGTIQNSPYIVSEYVPGETLESVLRKGKIEPMAVSLLFEQLINGMAYAHQQGVVHRDLKPANLFIGEQQDLKILDFGMARLLHCEQKITQTGQALGTPLYMSPEQVRTKFGPESDYYAAGVILFEMLTGRPPFSGTNTMEILSAHAFRRPPLAADIDTRVPAMLSELADRMLIKSPKQRLSDPLEVLAILERFRREAS